MIRRLLLLAILLLNAALTFAAAPVSRMGRDHGRSEKASGGYTLETLVGDVAAFLKTLNLTGVTLVGHSYGGTEVVRFAQRHPDVVRRAVVLDIAYASQGNEPETSNAALAKFDAALFIFSGNPTADRAQGRAVDAALMKEIEAADVEREAQRRAQINAIRRDSPQARGTGTYGASQLHPQARPHDRRDVEIPALDRGDSRSVGLTIFREVAR